MTKIFIDGKAGTTGLRIYDRLAERKDIELLTLSDEERKDATARKRLLNACDVAFLCLPDDAAREAVSMIENENVIVIDTSTAHRTLDDWAYGFPELDQNLNKKILSSKRIAVPGCYASGFIALVYPLIKENLIDKSALLTCFGISGYSGGGKKLIAEYESQDRSELLSSPRQYGITQTHKHLKEMQKITGLDNAPIFTPIVSDYYSGMVMTVPLFKDMLLGGKTVSDIVETYKKYYNTDIVKYVENADESGFVSSNALSGKDSMEITVYGNDQRILLTARYDNLGKGASGAAVECMNMVIGKGKNDGLVL